MKKIGIIGGMGASAGVYFFDLLVKECQRKGAVKDSDFPEVFVHNIPSRGMDEKGISDEIVLKKELFKSVAQMNMLEVDSIIIACNSVHVYIDELKSASRAAILNMIFIASESTLGSSKVGIICSNSSKKSGLYKKQMNDIGLIVFETTTREQDEVDQAIGNVISGSKNKFDEQILHTICLRMKRDGAEEIILGCTELPLLSHPEYCIDAGRKTIEKALST